MALTLACPNTPPNTRPPLYSSDWHRQQETEERAWLDDHIRAQHLPTTRTSR